MSFPPDKILRIRIPGDANETCVDKHESCSGWAMPGELGLASDEGECLKNPDWMAENCPLSCGECPVLETPKVPCSNLYRDCDMWATPGAYSAEVSLGKSMTSVRLTSRFSILTLAPSHFYRANALAMLCG